MPDASEFGTRYDPPKSLEDELKVLEDLQKQLKGSDGKGKGLKNYDEALDTVRSRWADGSRQKVRAEWEAEQLKKLKEASGGRLKTRDE